MAIVSNTLKTNHKKLLSKQYISDYIIVEKAKQLKKWLVVLADNPQTELRVYASQLNVHSGIKSAQFINREWTLRCHTEKWLDDVKFDDINIVILFIDP
jgi:hypothetical protein